jgi:hypothetical protein
VFTILGALNWVPEWFSPDGVATAGEVACRVADTLLLGLIRGSPAESLQAQPAGE